MSKARGLADLGNVYDDGALSNRNLIINGGMQVAQRGTSSTGVTTSDFYTCDRFSLLINTLGSHTLGQDTDAPDGFSNSFKIEVTTADASPAAGDYLALEHKLEGQNLQHLKYGTSSAESVTLSFWVKSNKTGTYIIEWDSNDNSRNINKTYTVNSSGVWEYKTLTFEGDTVGALDNDNGMSARLFWWLDGGSDFRGGTLATSWEATTSANRAEGNVSFGDTVGNYFQITGVQLEVGDTATPFEHRSYGDELARCQRYYYRYSSDASSDGVYTVGNAYTSSAAIGVVSLPVGLRAKPSVGYTGEARIRTGAGSSQSVSSLAITGYSNDAHGSILELQGTTSTSNLTTGQAAQFRIGLNDYLEFEAEL